MSLVATDICFAYPGGTELFGGCSLRVEPGERVALSAPSGAGKTTLCRILAGYLAPQRGSVEADGVAVSGRLPGRARRRPGARPVQLIWQHPEQAFDPYMRLGASLLEASEGNTVCNASVWDEVQRTLFDRFGIREAWLSRFPHELSGGELMRLAIVRALMVAPRYLICDEMTAMLDTVTQAQVWRALIDIACECDMGLVIVSHSPALVARVAMRVERL